MKFFIIFYVFIFKMFFSKINIPNLNHKHMVIGSTLFLNNKTLVHGKHKIYFLKEIKKPMIKIYGDEIYRKNHENLDRIIHQHNNNKTKIIK